MVMPVTKVRPIVVLDAVATGNLLVRLKNRRRSKTGEPRLLGPRPLRTGGRTPWSPRRINALLRGLPRASRYLEIGVEEGRTLENIDAEQRWGVDPAPMFDLSHLPSRLQFFKTTSDEFFQQLGPDAYFDVVFIDGLHTFEQSHTDLLNTLAHVSEGAVLIDDTVPCDEVSAIPDQGASLARRRELGLEGGAWHGEVWKLVVCVARHYPELEFRTIVGSGNPQTLLWRKRPGVEVAPPSGDALQAVSDLAYGEVFADGLPESFRPCHEHKALSACLTAVGPMRPSSRS